MRNNVLMIFIYLFALFIGFSCNTDSNEDQNTQGATSIKSVQPTGPDYSGVYKIAGENQCKLTITITKTGQEFNYQITGDKLNCSGKLIIENMDGDVYFTFDGQIDENAPKTVSGKYIEGSIMIQNVGNAMNEYQLFKQCEDKYLEFKK